MSKYRVGYFVGSLSTSSINRLLAKALVRLAPAELDMTEIPLGDLPLYNRDYDDDYPPVATPIQGRDRGRRSGAVRHTGIQPLNPRRIEERDRLGEPSVRQEFVRAQALGGHRNVSRQDRHGHRAATSAQHSRLLQLAANECHGSLHTVRARLDHRGRRGHERRRRRNSCGTT